MRKLPFSSSDQEITHYNCSVTKTAPVYLQTENSTNVGLSPAVSGSCLLPQYHIFTWILSMTCLASFLKLNYIIKTCVLLVMVFAYSILMMGAFPIVFSDIQVIENHKIMHLIKPSIFKIYWHIY